MATTLRAKIEYVKVDRINLRPLGQVDDMVPTIKEQILHAYQSRQDPDGMEDAVRLTAAWLNSRSEADLLQSGRALYGATADEGAVLLHMAVIAAGMEALAEVLKTVKALAEAPQDD